MANKPEYTVFTLNIRTGQIKIIIFFLSEHLIWKKIINFLVSEYLLTPKNYQSSRVYSILSHNLGRSSGHHR